MKQPFSPTDLYERENFEIMGNTMFAVMAARRAVREYKPLTEWMAKWLMTTLREWQHLSWRKRRWRITGFNKNGIKPLRETASA